MAKSFKTYVAPVVVKGKIADKRYTPEEICKLMGACGGGLRAIQAYYQRWGKKALTLCEIMEHVVPELDFGEPGHKKVAGVIYPLRDWSNVRWRLIDALVGAVVFKRFPYLWKQPDSFGTNDLCTSLSDFMDHDSISLGSRYMDNQGAFHYSDCAVDRTDLLYQLLHDAANGLLTVDILSFVLSDYDEDEYYTIVQRNRSAR